jgi:hypothetical protein
VDVKRDAEKEKFWRKAIREASGGGRSAREFCRERRELKRRDTEADDGSGFVELLQTAGRENRAGVSIRVGERINIVLERGFDAPALKAVLVVVGEVLPA